jgi:class 3 adenylate cyclase
MASTRRLAAILAADVAGYSRLIGADEEGTLERLKAHRRELMDPKIGEHRGRIVKTTGDGALAEFPSVVDAVRCAAEVQRGMLDREPGLPDERRIWLRIGINLGDVIAEGDDIFGDGVNVAARLEALAEPGGVCISGMVHDQVRGKLPYPLDNRGEQNVKDIALPVRVYTLRPEAIAELPPSGLPVAAPRRRNAASQWGWQSRRCSLSPELRGGSGRRQSPHQHQRSLRIRQSRNRSPRRGCRSLCCRSLISAATRASNILPTVSPTI